MKKIFFALIVTGLVASGAMAGEAKVTWQEPEKFTDIQPGNETRAGFQERVFKDFEQFFADMAKKLPEGYQLEVTVTDLDLAGDVNGMNRIAGRDIRIVREIYWPRMSFSYTLKNAGNELIASGKEQLKDMNFMSRAATISGRTGFEYEERMLNDWFAHQQKMKIFPNR